MQLIFEVLATREDCPPEIRSALEKMKETNQIIDRLLSDQDSETITASNEALALALALETGMSVEEIKSSRVFGQS